MPSDPNINARVHEKLTLTPSCRGRTLSRQLKSGTSRASSRQTCR